MFEFKRFPMLDLDDGLDIGGTGAEEQEVADPVIEEGAEEPEVAEPVRNDSDSAFAELRRRAEEDEETNWKRETLNMTKPLDYSLTVKTKLHRPEHTMTRYLLNRL